MKKIIREGFTLLELMIAVMIIGIMMIMVFAVMLGWLQVLMLSLCPVMNYRHGDLNHLLAIHTRKS